MVSLQLHCVAIGSQPPIVNHENYNNDDFNDDFNDNDNLI